MFQFSRAVYIPDELVAPACVYTIIACFGAAGGAASGFFAGSISHGERTAVLPNLTNRERLGINVLVGIVGAFAFVPFGARILDLDFSHVAKSDGLADHLKCVLFLSSLSSVGGFAGYRMLSVLANKMLARVEELDNRTKSLEIANVQLKNENRVQQLELLEANANIAITNETPAHALAAMAQFFEIYATFKDAPVDLIATGYKQKARALKQCQRVQEALEQVNTALELKGIEARSAAILLFNKACYKSLLLNRPATEEQGAEIVRILASAYQKVTFNKEKFLADTDFNNIRETAAFKVFEKM